MNEIEKKFYDALIDALEKEYGYTGDEGLCGDELGIFTQRAIGIYKVDFVVEMNHIVRSGKSFVIEIDGHDAHKTKEQRYKDYCRERFLQNKGYTVIRFTGSEVYVDADNCAMEALEIMKAECNAVLKECNKADLNIRFEKGMIDLHKSLNELSDIVNREDGYGMNLPYMAKQISDDLSKYIKKFSSIGK